MFIHLVILAKFDGREIAYHFSSEDAREIIAKRDAVRDYTSVSPASYSVHILKTNRPDFKSIQEMDPYFENVRDYDELDLFFDVLKSMTQLNSEDVAAFLLRKYRLPSFVLQKTVYYIYADTLEINKQPLFQAKFLAFDKGPVDQDVYREYTYHRQELTDSYGLEEKVMAGTVAASVIDQLDKRAKYYHAKFDGAWEDSQNPTHSVGTPWHVAHDRGGRNERITDADIRQHHKAELI